MAFAAGGAAAAATDQPWTTLCTVVGVDTTSFSYLACSACDRPLAVAAAACPFCSRTTFSPAPTRLFRLLLSIATDDRVMVVVCFDRAARVLLGCSADELFAFCRDRPSAAEKTGEMLEGEMCRMTLSRPRNGAQHLRVTSVMPMRTDFCPVIHELKKLYGLALPSSS